MHYWQKVRGQIKMVRSCDAKSGRKLMKRIMTAEINKDDRRSDGETYYNKTWNFDWRKNMCLNPALEGINSRMKEIFGRLHSFGIKLEYQFNQNIVPSWIFRNYMNSDLVQEKCKKTDRDSEGEGVCWRSGQFVWHGTWMLSTWLKSRRTKNVLLRRCMGPVDMSL